MVKVFVSHHNTDKRLLAEVGEWMRHYGFNLFLAHDAIRVGEDDLKAIKDNLTDCQLFFAYGSEKAMASPACNQEIGVALGLEKPYILALMPDMRPWGIMPNSQAIVIQDDISADELFPHRSNGGNGWGLPHLTDPAVPQLVGFPGTGRCGFALKDFIIATTSESAQTNHTFSRSRLVRAGFCRQRQRSRQCGGGGQCG